MITENAYMQTIGNNGTDICGHIKLKKLAIPETVKVSIRGQQLIPFSFDIYGHPNFTTQQEQIIAFLQQKVLDEMGNDAPILSFEVTYEQEEYEFERDCIDTVEGIKNMLCNMFALNWLIDERKRFIFSTDGEEQLNEFVLFNYLLLDKYGRVKSLKSQDIKNVKIDDSVVLYSQFKKENPFLHFIEFQYIIPKEEQICACCAQMITVENLKAKPCIEQCEDKKLYVYHEECYLEYIKLKVLTHISQTVMKSVYKFGDYSLNTIRNVYYPESYKPSVFAHTIDGDFSVTKITDGKIVIRFDNKHKFCEFLKPKELENGNLLYEVLAEDEFDARNYLIKSRNLFNPDYAL